MRFGIDGVYEFYAASEGNIAFVNLLNVDCTVGLCPAPYALIAYDVDRDEPVRGPDGNMVRVGRGEVGLLIAEVSERYSFDGYTDKAASEEAVPRRLPQGRRLVQLGRPAARSGLPPRAIHRPRRRHLPLEGENVSTNEVAEALNTFHQVAESTVYGVQIPGADGRCGMAALVLRCSVDEFDSAAFSRHVETQLPPYARPVFLRIRPRPRSPARSSR